MKTLKCIGGAADGRLAHVYDYCSKNDFVNVPAKMQFTVADFDIATASDKLSSSVPYYVYRICELEYRDRDGGPRLKIQYLIPSNWHEWEAMQHLFSSHHEQT